jgi:outer membrane protein
MKTHSSFLRNLCAGVMIAGSLAACNQPKTTDKPVAATPEKANLGIAYINFDTLNSKYNYIKDMNKRLEEKGKTAQGNVASRQQAIQREFAEYQRNGNTMTAEQRQTTEQRIGREQQDFQQYQQNEAAEFQNVKGTENQKLFDKISGLTKTYAKEKGYKLVMTYANGSLNLLYGDPSIDVTSDFIKRLNDEYAKEKK